MAHFTRIRAFGTWTDGSVVLPSEMELFDAHQSKTINGDEGGVWAPSSVIEIGGAGLKVTGPFIVTSSAQLQGGAAVTGGDLSVAQDASIQGDLDVDGTATVNALAVVTDAIVQGDAAVQGALDVTGDITTDADVAAERVAIHSTHLGSNILSVGGDARVTGDVEINGAFACDGAASFGSTISIAGPVTPTGAGRVRRKVFTGPDNNTTFTAASAQQLLVLSLTADRTYTLSVTDAANGDIFRVSMRVGSHQVSLVAQGTNPITYLLKLNAATFYDWLELTFLDGGWYLTSFKIT